MVDASIRFLANLGELLWSRIVDHRRPSAWHVSQMKVTTFRSFAARIVSSVGNYY
jgi:hypothetical protein